MFKLRDHFLQPPSGGNGRGIRTSGTMAPGQGFPVDPPGQDGNLRLAFDAAAAQAQNAAVGGSSRRMGVADLRNHDRGLRPAQGPLDPSGLSAYDMEAESCGHPCGKVGGKDPAPANRNPAPTYNPAVPQTTRSDGRPV